MSATEQAVEMEGRSERLVAALDGAGADLALVTELVNVRYLTGYTGSNGLALIGPNIRVFVTDFRYVEQAREQVDPSFERVQAAQDLIDSLNDQLPSGSIRLGFDDVHTSVREHARLVELLGERVELVATGGLVEKLRLVKGRSEVELIAAATQIADEAFEALIEGGLMGRTERELALRLETTMRELGADHPSFDTIIAAGPHGALPHATPRDVEVKRGDVVVIDWGAQRHGYCSDCTRTVFVGEPSDPDARLVYDVVLEAQLAGLAAVRADADGRATDSVARDIIEGAGHGAHYGHGLGHGVGLDIHEAPRLSQRSTDVLGAGNVVTVEPGIYLPGRFGVRIEDLVVVTEDGSEILTGVPKEFRIVD
jgi:Xaa-Pro aminopeptidase